MLQWSYLWNPPLDHAEFWIYCSSYTPLLTNRRDMKAHNLFYRNHHQNVPGKQKKIHLQGSFDRRPISLSSTIGSCLFLDMWCAQKLPSFQKVKIINSLSSKVLLMLNSSSFIFRLARFYSDIGRSNYWSILILRYMVHNSMIYILIVLFKTIIGG